MHSGIFLFAQPAVLEYDLIALMMSMILMETNTGFHCIPLLVKIITQYQY